MPILAYRANNFSRRVLKFAYYEPNNKMPLNVRVTIMSVIDPSHILFLQSSTLQPHLKNINPASVNWSGLYTMLAIVNLGSKSENILLSPFLCHIGSIIFLATKVHKMVVFKSAICHFYIFG